MWQFSFRNWAVGILLSILVTGTLFANPKFSSGLNFAVGLPQGEFKSSLDANGYGLGLEFFYQLPENPLALGVVFNYLIYGNETRRVPFNSNYPNLFLEVETSNNIFQGYLAGRLQTPQGKIRPYLEWLVGVSYFTTQTSIKDEDGSDDLASDTEQDDATFSYGGGPGVMIPVYTNENEGGLAAVLIDFKVRYLVGGEAEYLQEGSIVRDKGKISYDVSRSKTDLLMLQFGVSLQF